jgi:hypothetical protein
LQIERSDPFSGLQIDYRIGGNPIYYLGSRRLTIVPDEIRKCVAYIMCKVSSGAVKPAGTVFFVGTEYPDVGLSSVFAVTARHLIEGVRERSSDGKVYVRMNFRDGGWRMIATDIDAWRFHPTDSHTDVAVLPFSSAFSANHDHQFFPLSGFSTDEVMAKWKIGIGDEIFLVGLFYGHIGRQRNTPIVRVGNIAAMPEEPVETEMGFIDAYLVEARSIGGLSGSPVFVHLGPIRTDQDGKIQSWGWGGGMYYLLGSMLGHWKGALSEADSVQVDRQDVREPLNWGVGVVVPAKKILEAVHRPEFDESTRQDIERARKAKLPKPD